MQTVTLQFDYTGSPARILFGAGIRNRLPEMVRDLGCSRVLVLATSHQKDDADTLACALGDLCLGVYANATMHTPVTVTDAAMQVVSEQRVDLLIALGGGSTTGLAKAIAYRTDLPQIILPTTYAGSEVTPILGQTDKGVKNTLKSPRVLPEVVLYDPELSSTLPMEMSITSGINALAHAVEALYAQDNNPISSLMAAEGARSLIWALPRLYKDPQDGAGREKALYGAWLCGTVLGNVGMALHHKLCHTLGGTFDLPHAETHTVVLPHATAYNAPSVPQELAPIAEALGTDKPGLGLFHFARKLGAPTSLRELGMQEESIDRAADIAMANPYWNPRKLEHEKIRALIKQAYFGTPPDQ